MKTTNKELPINVSTLIKGMFYLILKGREGGKYKTRKKIVDKKTGKMRWGGYTYDRPIIVLSISCFLITSSFYFA